MIIFGHYEPADASGRFSDEASLRNSVRLGRCVPLAHPSSVCSETLRALAMSSAVHPDSRMAHCSTVGVMGTSVARPKRTSDQE